MLAQCKPCQYTRWQVAQHWKRRWRARTAGGRRACAASQGCERSVTLQCRHKVNGRACACKPIGVGNKARIACR